MASNILFIASLSALHLPAGHLQSSHPSRSISCTNCSAFHLKLAARLPYLNRSAGKIDVNRILSFLDTAVAYEWTEPSLGC